MTTRNDNGTNQYPRYHALRVGAIVVGSILVVLSLVAWFPYLKGSLEGLDPQPEPDHGVTNEDIVAAFFGFWLLVWIPGILLTIAGTAGWRKRAMWGFVALAVAMLATSGVTYLVGISTG